VPGIGDIPVLGNLFKSKSFTKQETELMFIVTAQLVKPVNPDDLPQMRGVDGLKNGSPLGVEPKGEGIQGAHGFSTGSGATTDAPAATPAAPASPSAPAKADARADAVTQASLKPAP
jgi:pilus assembly protein CpaC